MLDVCNSLYYSAPKLERGYNLVECHKTQILLMLPASKIEADSMRKQRETG